MGSRLFRTLVGVGISLGGAATGCLGQSSDAGESAPRDPSDAGSGGTDGQAVEGSSAGTTLSEVSGSSTTSSGSSGAPTGRGASATVGTTGAGATNGDSDTAGGSGGSGATGGSGGTAAGGNAGNGGASAGGVGGSGDGGSGGTEPGAAGQGGDGTDPFCDTTWPTTKGNPSVPECVDPEHQCENEWPLRCLIPVGEFACDGHFEHAYAPFCIQGEWECESGLVPVSECRCLAPIAEGYICTEDGIMPLEGAAP